MNKDIGSTGSKTAGRILARVLAEDLTSVVGGDLNQEIKSVSCGTNCDQLVNDCLKLPDDSFNE